MVFNWQNYLEAIIGSIPLEYWILNTAFLIIVEIMLLFYLGKSYRNFKQNLSSLEPVQDYLLAMTGLAVWNMGEVCTGLTRVLTMGQYSALNGVDNFFVPIGATMTIMFFSRYIQTTIRTRRYNKRRELLTHRFFNICAVLSAIAIIIMLGRFLLLGFMPSQFRVDSEPVMIITLVILTFLITIILFFGIIQLYSEYMSISSKINRSRLIIYLIFLGSLILAGVFLALSLIALEVSPEGIVSNIYVPIPIFLSLLLAMLSLYYGMFMPIWLQKRMGVLPSL
ncbi:MAG: hypothetical protein ACFFC7_26735 [Candidatus Hermodarchaeota archaeon]